MNEHVNVKGLPKEKDAEKQSDVRFQLDFSKHEWGGGGGATSGHVPEGFYELTVVSDPPPYICSKKDGTGAYTLIDTTVTSPAGEWVGTRIVDRVPVPIGLDTAEEVVKAERRALSLYASFFSGQGKYDEAKAAPKPVTLNQAMLAGGKLYAFIAEDDPYNGQPKSRVAFYVSAKDFAEKPGPSAGVGAPVATGAQPDLMASGGNGTSAPAVGLGAPAQGGSAVDSFLGGQS